jgi:hypothetical protein
MAQDADVANALFAATFEQRTHTGFVHLAAQKVVAGRAWAIFAVASPMPKPISSTKGPSRPNAAAGLSNWSAV